MNGFLVDTNVPSELTRPKSDANVEAWLDDGHELGNHDLRLGLSREAEKEEQEGEAAFGVVHEREQHQGWLAKDNISVARLSQGHHYGIIDV